MQPGLISELGRAPRSLARRRPRPPLIFRISLHEERYVQRGVEGDAGREELPECLQKLFYRGSKQPYG